MDTFIYIFIDTLIYSSVDTLCYRPSSAASKTPSSPGHPRPLCRSVRRIRVYPNSMDAFVLRRDGNRGESNVPRKMISKVGDIFSIGS